MQVILFVSDTENIQKVSDIMGELVSERRIATAPDIRTRRNSNMDNVVEIENNIL